MTLARVFYIVGIVFIVWALISGINLSLELMDGDTTFDSSYTFKLGFLILGIILVIVGRRAKDRSS